MSWYDIEDVLYDGSEEDIKNLKCPDCNGLIHHHYDEKSNSLKYGCKKCGIVMKGYKCSTKPNCSKYEG
ncbi:MAG: hypothetical protein LKJ92_06920 [Ruminococcus sp.]|jgi:hypothetical protein|nr:hypothetical protein [Ruminococcus sp.]